MPLITVDIHAKKRQYYENRGAGLINGWNALIKLVFLLTVSEITIIELILIILLFGVGDLLIILGLSLSSYLYS